MSQLTSNPREESGGDISSSPPTTPFRTDSSKRLERITSPRLLLDNRVSDKKNARYRIAKEPVQRLEPSLESSPRTIEGDDKGLDKENTVVGNSLFNDNETTDMIDSSNQEPADPIRDVIKLSLNEDNEGTKDVIDKRELFKRSKDDRKTDKRDWKYKSTDRSQDNKVESKERKEENIEKKEKNQEVKGTNHITSFH